MADNSNTQAPRVSFIPEQLAPAGKFFEIDLSQFVEAASTEILEYSVDGVPAGFSIDQKTGILSGQAPEVELNESHLVTLTVTNIDTEQYTSTTFNLEFIGSLLLETEEGQAFFGGGEITYASDLKPWQVRLFIQQLIREHFAWVMAYNVTGEEMSMGKLIGHREAKSGWLIIDYENVVMVTPGKKAFEQYGARRQILDTLREMLMDVVSEKSWQHFDVSGSDEESISKCWVIARELDLPINPTAPSDIAEINYFNIKRVFRDNTPSKPKPQPG